MCKMSFLRVSFLGILILLAGLTGCSDIDDVKSDVRDLQEEVSNLQNTVSQLQSALQAGKMVSSIEPLADMPTGGWNIRFSDGSSIRVVNGADGENGVIITEVAKDEDTRIVTLTLSDGSVFSFNLDVVYPTGIVVLTNEVYLFKNAVTTFEFRVNPSNAVFDFDVEGGNSCIELDLVGSTRAAASYITPPAHYKLIKIETAKDDKGEVKQGQYKAYVQDLNVAQSYRENVALVLSTKDGEGNPIQLSSAVLKFSFYDQLPIVYMTTPGGAGITSKDNWLKDCYLRIVNPDGSEDMAAAASFKGRGNSTWGYPKKPYAIKLDSKSAVLGMPKHKRWVLLANWMDRTLLRNSVAFEVARQTDLEWTPRGTFVEVFLNGQHLGNYYLCEQIKVDKNRVNIAEMESGDIGGEAVTGGYLMELDTYYDEVNKFRTSICNLPVNMKEPDEDVLVPAQLTYITDYMNRVEQTLYGAGFASSRSYTELLDVNSFIDWWLVHELTQNGEPNHPKSSYMNKDRSGKLKAGPVWDFDWGTFIPGFSGFRIKDAIWYGRLFEDPAFVAEVKQRWTVLKPKFESVLQFIDMQAAMIKKSAEVNSRMWPISISVNGDEDLDFDAAVKRLRKAYSERIQALDAAIRGLSGN